MTELLPEKVFFLLTANHKETVSVPLDLSKEARHFIAAGDHLAIKGGPSWENKVATQRIINLGP